MHWAPTARRGGPEPQVYITGWEEEWMCNGCHATVGMATAAPTSAPVLPPTSAPSQRPTRPPTQSPTTRGGRPIQCAQIRIRMQLY